eukprot:14132-Heterococcus_DN1.PRE.13
MCSTVRKRPDKHQRAPPHSYYQDTARTPALAVAFAATSLLLVVCAQHNTVYTCDRRCCCACIAEMQCVHKRCFTNKDSAALARVAVCTTHTCLTLSLHLPMHHTSLLKTIALYYTTARITWHHEDLSHCTSLNILAEEATANNVISAVYCCQCFSQACVVLRSPHMFVEGKRSNQQRQIAVKAVVASANSSM